MKEIFQNRSKVEPNLKEKYLCQPSDRKHDEVDKLYLELETTLDPFERELNSQEQDSFQHKFFQLFSSVKTESLSETLFK